MMALSAQLGKKRFVVYAAVWMLLSTTVWAQMTGEDIAALQKKGAQKGWTFKVGKTIASTRPMNQLCGLTWPDAKGAEALTPAPRPITAKGVLPARWDWREQVPGGFAPVRDQGSCGSCWAFSVVGALECAIRMHDGILVDLSEQWLLGCNTEVFMHDCSGGLYAHNYHIDKGDSCGLSGAVLEADCPYQAKEDVCGCPYTHHYWIREWHYVGSLLSVPPTNDIKQAIYDYGPVCASWQTSKSLIAYKGGVFNDATEEKDKLPDHAIIIVGWDDSQGTSGAWIVRNSWGDDWGMNGYGYVEYGVNMIGYGANYIVYGDPADDLTVAPVTNFSSEGDVVDGFSPVQSTYTLTNSGTAALPWTAETPVWMTATPVSGTLAAGASADVLLAINTTQLENGEQNGKLRFINQDSSAAVERTCKVTVYPPVIAQFNLDADPGWTTTGLWEYGTPTGQGTNNPDPTSGYTGNHVYGYNLDGDYENNLSPVYLTAGPFDFSAYTDIEMHFMRWLGVEESEYDHAFIEVSIDGQDWSTVWGHIGDTLSEAVWTAQSVELSTLVDQQSAVYVRWVMGETDNSIAYCGWNIDDITFRGNSASAEGEGEGATEGEGEGSGEGEGEGATEGEGEGSGEGEGEGATEGEGEGSGEGEGEMCPVDCTSMCDTASIEVKLRDAYTAVYAAAGLTVDTADLDENGMLDLAAAYLLEMVLANSSIHSFCCTRAAWSYNRNAVDVALLALDDGLFTTLSRAVLGDFIAAELTIQGSADGSVLRQILEELGISLRLEEVAGGARQYLAYDGDVDRDGVCNLAEYNAVVTTSVDLLTFVLTAIDPTYADNGGGCFPPCYTAVTVEGEGEGAVEGEGEGEGVAEGEGEATVEGEGEGLAEGEGEGTVEGEGATEGEGEESYHSADQDQNWHIELSELLRVIQFFNSSGYHRFEAGEDGYAPGLAGTEGTPHTSDYNPQDWRIELNELLRLIQFFNSTGYQPNMVTGEDGFAPGKKL